LNEISNKRIFPMEKAVKKRGKKKMKIDGNTLQKADVALQKLEENKPAKKPALNAKGVVLSCFDKITALRSYYTLGQIWRTLKKDGGLEISFETFRQYVNAIAVEKGLRSVRLQKCPPSPPA